MSQTLNPIAVPFNLSFEKWAALLAFSFPDQLIPYPLKAKEWTKWAALLRMIDYFQDVPVPDPKIYIGEEGWRSWAMFFIFNYS